MNAYTELNIKKGMPLAFEAMSYLKNSLERLRKNKYHELQDLLKVCNHGVTVVAFS